MKCSLKFYNTTLIVKFINVDFHITRVYLIITNLFCLWILTATKSKLGL